MSSAFQEGAFGIFHKRVCLLLVDEGIQGPELGRKVYSVRAEGAIHRAPSQPGLRGSKGRRKCSR